MKKNRVILICFTFIALLSCTSKGKNPSIQAGEAIQLDDLPGSCPYVTRDSRGDVVVSWAKAINDSGYVFCYAISADRGKSFGKPVIIPGSNNIQPHSENLPKIIFKPSGEIIALWGIKNANPLNKYSGLVYYSQSFDNGVTWNNPQPLVNDTASYDQRYYDVDLLANGEVAIIWLDNRKLTDKEGSSLYFASTEGRNGFQNEKMIGEGCCQCCRTDLFVDSKNNIHVLFRGIINDSIRDMIHRVSNDGGKSFSVPGLVSNDNWVLRGCPHTGPAMSENKEGLHFAWFTGGKGKGCYYTKSTDNGHSFYPRNEISTEGSHPQLSSLPGGKIIVVWDEAATVNDKYYKRIAMQLRTAEGKGEAQTFLTADTLVATYPVIAAISDHLSVIAYTLREHDKDYVVCRQVETE